MSELQLYKFNLLVVDDLVIPLFGVICVSVGITILYISIRCCSRLRSDNSFQSNFFINSVTLVFLP